MKKSLWGIIAWILLMGMLHVPMKPVHAAANDIKVVALDSEQFGYSGCVLDYNILYSEEPGYLYTLRPYLNSYGSTDGYEIIKYDITNDTYETIYRLKGAGTVYCDNNMVYLSTSTYTRIPEEERYYDEDGVLMAFANEVIMYRYDLNTEQVTSVKLEGFDTECGILGGKVATAFCVDDRGRYLVFTEEDHAYVRLFDADGTFISKGKSPCAIYRFTGYDKTNGNFYYEGRYDWIYWGYSHAMYSLMAGNVDQDNNVKVVGANLTMLFQKGYMDHGVSTRMLNDRYLADLTVCNHNALLLIDSNSYDVDDHTTQTNSISLIDSSVSFAELNVNNTDVVKFAVSAGNTVTDGSGDDISSMGTRCDLTDDDKDIIVKTDQKELTRYDIATNKKKYAMTTEYPVYDFRVYGEHLVAVERDADGNMYVEEFDMNVPEDFLYDGPTGMTVGESGTVSAYTESNVVVDYIFESSDNSIVSVDEMGGLNAWREGTATVTITSKMLGVSHTIEIEVAASQLSVNDYSFTLATTQGVASDIIHKPVNDGWYGSVTTAYLTPLDNGGYERVEWIEEGQLVVEQYSSEKEFVSCRNIECELSLFGGFYSGKDYNYLVFGQTNADALTDQEVLRVVRYDKLWNRIDACAIAGANTDTPFSHGGLDMTEVSGKLYIHTCHTMYDGHQANCTFVIQESDMTLVDSQTETKNLGSGYVSHSMMQKIVSDGDVIYRADVGDEYPRGIALTGTDKDALISKPYLYGTAVAIPEPGNKHYNYTGYSLGGLEVTDKWVVMAGTGIMETDAPNSNLYVYAITKMAEKDNKNWITHYDAETSITVTNSKLVKINANQLLILWEEYNQETHTFATKMAMIDPSGRIASDVYTTPLALSGCDPVVNAAGNVVWYVTNQESPVFVEMNPYHLWDVAQDSKDVDIFATKEEEKSPTGSGDESENPPTDLRDELGKTPIDTDDKLENGAGNFGGGQDTGVTIDWNHMNNNAIPSSDTENGDAMIDRQISYKGIDYKIVSEGQVSVIGVSNRSVKTITIPDTIVYAGMSYKVISIESNAFKGFKKLKKLTIGKNVVRIGKNAFNGCKKLKSVRIKSAKLTQKCMGAKAFAGIHGNASVKVPAKKFAEYKKLLKKRGLNGRNQKVIR